MRRLLIVIPFVIAFLGSSTSLTAADDGNPEFNGKKLSDWNAMLRESPSARLRKVAVVAMSQIASDHPTQTKMVKEIATTFGKAMRNDSAAAVRAEAAKALGKAAGQLLDDRAADVGSVVVDLTEGLRVEKESEVRLEAAVALGRYGKQAKGAVQALAGVLTDKDAKVKEASATTLGRIGPDAKPAVEDLIGLLKDAEPAVRKAAAFAIGRAEPDDVSKPSLALAEVLKKETAVELRLEIVTSLGLLGDKSQDVVTAVAAALTDKDTGVRRQAAQSLGKFFVGAKAADKALLAAFKTDPDKLVRAYALHSVCLAYGEEAKSLIPHLTERLDPAQPTTFEKEPEVRIAICDELGAMGPEATPAVPAIRIAMKDPETKVRDAATSAMKKVLAKPTGKTDR
jgi:HEAT repeat protein